MQERSGALWTDCLEAEARPPWRFLEAPEASPPEAPQNPEGLEAPRPEAPESSVSRGVQALPEVLRGLRPAGPPGASSRGLFGKGTYFAEVLPRSINT